MKLTAIIFFCILLQASAHSYAQNVTLNVKQASLQQIFREIHKQTGFQFFYDNALLAAAGTMDIDVSNTPLNDLLKTCFKNQPFTYEIISNTIVIREKMDQNDDHFAVTINTDQPGHEVQGRVLNQEGQAVPGITVTVKGTTQVTTTNEKGEFSLTNVNENTVLVFTAVNVEKMETIVGSRSTMTLTLQIKRSILDDIQIIGYGSTSRKLNTGSMGSITSAEIENQPVVNPLMALEGRVAGVEMTVNSGEPGTAIDVKIRGVNTAFAATANPLFIVDGVAFPYNISVAYDPTIGTVNTTNALNSINPGDIENITILKDADATAVYGSRGANGVVLITTKKGKAGATKLSLDLSTGFSNAAHMIDGYLKTPEYLAMRNQAFINDGITPTIKNAPDLTLWSQTAYTDWEKEILGNTGNFSNLQASLSGGDDRVRYLFSAAYTYNKGIVWGTNFDKRASAHLNIENNSKDKRFQMSTSLTYSNDNIEKTGNNPMDRTSPNFPKYDSTGALYLDPNHRMQNPYLLKNQYSTYGTDNLILDTKLSYLILPNLKISASVGYTKYAQTGFQAMPTNSFDPYLSPTFNQATNSYYNISTFVTEPQLDYNTHISKGKLQVMVGGTWQDQLANTGFITGQNYSSDALLHNIGAAANIAVQQSGNTQYKYESVFTRATYNWEDRYILNGSYRRDGSSRFGEGYKFGDFWSAGAAWIFSNESFFKNAGSIINYGKLRGSYGLTGNDQIGDYQYLSFYSPTDQPYNGAAAIYSSQFTNNNYRWEQTYKGDIGIELAAFNSRVLLTVDYFNNRSESLLSAIPLAVQSGYQSYTGNMPAVVQNKGWEFTLNTVNIKGKDFKWSTSFNLTVPKNTLLAYPGLESSSFYYQYEVGKSIRAVREIKFAGIRPSDGLLLFYTADGTVTDGSGSPGNPEVGLNDFQYIGTDDPAFFGGLGNIFTYKTFELNVFVQFSSSHTDQSYLITQPRPVGFEENTIQALANNSWTKPGQDASQPQWTTSSSTPSGEQYGTYAFNSSANFVNNSYIRLKTLALTWNMPVRWSSAAKFSNVQVYAQAQNLFTITSYTGLDPESTRQVPVLRTITFGLRANL